APKIRPAAGKPPLALLPPRSTAGQLTLDQHIGVRIPGGQPKHHFRWGDSSKLVNDVCFENRRKLKTLIEGGIMAKGYWIVFYRSVTNPAALNEYAHPAGAAILAAGGRFLTRGPAIKVAEAGIKERSVVIEFDSVTKAIEAYESPAYQSALKFLEGAV